MSFYFFIFFVHIEFQALIEIQSYVHKKEFETRIIILPIIVKIYAYLSYLKY